MLTVFALTGVALDHLVAGLEAGEGHIGDRVLLMVGLLGGDDGCEGGKREVNTGEANVTLSTVQTGKARWYSRNQVGLELVQIDVEGTVESEGSGDGGNNLSNQPVQVG